MRTRTLAVAFCIAAGSTAAAQPPPPAPPAPPPAEPPPIEPTTPPTEPTPPPDQPQPPPAQPPPAAPEPMPAAEDYRPLDFSIGIGVGYQFPTSLETPNITSVRFRLTTGLTFEPQVILARTTETVDNGDPVDDNTTQLGLGALVRYPLMKRGRVDLELLGAADVDSVTEDPDGDDNSRTTTTIAVAYGLAVSTWITRHWQISVSSINPIIAFAKVRQEMGPMNVLVTSQTTFGAIFDPTVFAMVHLYH